MKKELLTLPDDVRYPLCFSGVRVTQSLVFCVVFCRPLLFLLYFSVSSVLLRIMALVYHFGKCQHFVGFDLVYGV